MKKNSYYLGKYRLGSDNVFLPSKAIPDREDYIGEIGLDIKYKLINLRKNKEEIANEGSFLSIYPANYLFCYFDRDYPDYIKINVKEKELKELGYKLEYEIDGYYKGLSSDVSICAVFPLSITKEEFYKILEENLELFDNNDNKPTQKTIDIWFRI